MGKSYVLILLYISNEDFTINGANLYRPFDNDKNPFKIEVNITSIDL